MRAAAQGYLLLIGLVIIGIAVILRIGASIPEPAAPAPPSESASAVSSVATPAAAPSQDDSSSVPPRKSGDPLTRLLLQLVVIITVSYLVGWLFGRFGQPRVVGEMMAG